MNEQDLNFTEAPATRVGRPKKISDELMSAAPAKHIDRTSAYIRDRRNQIINGQFHYVTKPGNTLKFSCYLDEGDSEKPIILKDGELKPLKRKQVDYLNKAGLIPIYKIAKDANGCENLVFSHNIKRWYYEIFDFVQLDEISE